MGAPPGRWAVHADSEHHPILEALMQGALSAVPTEGVCQQSGKHGGRRYLPGYAQLVDDLPTEGH